MRRSLFVSIGVIAVLLSAAAGSYLTYFKLVTQYDQDSAELALSRLNDELKIVTLIPKAKLNDPATRKIAKLTRAIVLNQLILVAILKPKVDELDADAIEGLCRAETYRRRSSHPLTNQSDIIEGIISRYLDRVEPKVAEAAKKYQGLFRGTGCNIFQK